MITPVITKTVEPVSDLNSDETNPTPTAVLAASQNLILEEEIPLIASPLPDPLEFIFPTAEPQAVSLWRPPLYPTPWEPTPNDHFYFTRPIGANDVNWPLARYRYGYLLYAEPHTGIDIPAPKGTPIMAAGSGTVLHAGYGLYFMSDVYRDPYGIAVAIKHDFGYRGKTLYTIYGHLDRVDVFRGQKVAAGEVIGLVGETGKVSGPHLHMEVRIGDNNFFSSRNPELWISPPQGWGILVGRVVELGGRKIPQVKARLVRIETQRVYEVISYAQGSANSDDYYDENLVLGDLPAGAYLFYLDFEGQSVKTELEIRSGEVTFFEYRSTKGFDFTRPPDNGPVFIPPDITDTPAENQPSPSP
jgi:murein DD-endopeptidase MepM/ murein hydrolase activator NlpD